MQTDAKKKTISDAGSVDDAIFMKSRFFITKIKLFM